MKLCLAPLGALAALALAGVLSGCASAPPPRVSSTEPRAAALPDAPAPKQALARETDPAAAPDNACSDLDDCTALGLRLAAAGQTKQAIAPLEKACGRVVSNIDACAQLAILLEPDAAVARERIARLAHLGCSVNGTASEHRALRGEACFLFAQSLRAGVRPEGSNFPYTPDLYVKDSCTLGHAPACALARSAARERDEESGVPGATMHIDGISSNGMKLENVACALDPSSGLGGLFGSATLGVAFAQRKQKLDACAPKGSHTTRVRWVGKGGVMTRVTVISPPAASDACVQRAMTGAPTAVAGTCAATFRHGK
jgi:hypothetical protein